MKIKNLNKSLLILLLLVFLTTKTAFAKEYDYEKKVKDGYSFVLIPDSQSLVEFYPDIMTTSIDGLINQKDELNIKGVLHVGDIVNRHNNEEQFIFAANEINKIAQAGIKTILTPGNHDYTWLWDENQDIVGVDDLYYSQYFGPESKFLSLNPHTVIDSPSKRSSYTIVESGQKYDYLILSLSWFDVKTNPQELEWAEEILKENLNIPTIILSHNVLRPSLKDPGRVVFSWESSSISDELWDLIKKYDQVFMVFSGHHQGTGHMKLKNDKDNDVHFILSDYQFSHQGGNGHMEYVEFDETYNKIHINTYSPYLGSMDKDKISQEDLLEGNHLMIDFNFDQRFGSLPVKTDYNFHWAQNAIDYVVENEIMEIDQEKMAFRPEENASRYEVVQALASLEGIKRHNHSGASLPDVDSKYMAYVNWAMENDIVKGYEDNSFRGENEISREEMAAILNRYIVNLEKDIKEKDLDLSYKDQALISDWALDDVISVSKRGLLKGKDHGKFDPKSNIKRAELAQIIVNIIELSH